MANLKEDWIDFGKLEQELEQAVEKDARYWRENDAKFRAVEQRVETYEQFRDIVKAAHIKPLEKKDKIGEGKRNQPWNPYTSKSTGPEPSKAEDFSGQELNKLPKTSHEFTRDWKSRCKTTREKYGLLTRLGAEQLGKIFKVEIGFGLLGNLVGVLNEQFEVGDLQCIVDILEILAGTNRFGLSVEFLTKIEREQCVELFQKLQEESVKLPEERSLNTDLASELRTTDEDMPKASTRTEQQPRQLDGKVVEITDKLLSLRKVYKL